MRRLRLWSLEERRNREDSVEILSRGLADLNSWSRPVTVERTCGRHTMKLTKRRCLLDIWRFFFSERAMNTLNRLTQEALDSLHVNPSKGNWRRSCVTGWPSLMTYSVVDYPPPCITDEWLMYRKRTEAIPSWIRNYGSDWDAVWHAWLSRGNVLNLPSFVVIAL